MCAITGIFDCSGQREVNVDLLRAMNDIQAHRGPDDSGIHVEPGVGLAHRRLSIIDLSGGHQPLFNEDSSVAAVYNGEIYNFGELTRELEQHGHRFTTHCDSEVIVHAWEQWGEQCVSRFRGMFAFALWDRKRQVLFMARDRLGIKPLYYTFTSGGRLLFASELKGILTHPDVTRELEPRSIEDYFAYGYVPDPRTILKDVYKLPPAHVLIVKRGDVRPEPKSYWDITFAASGMVDPGSAQTELIERLREAVSIRMMADVPLGAFLSGGVDSSAVVSLMAGMSSDPVNTCSISFGEPQFDESTYAGKVARRYGTRHRVERVESGDFSLVDRLAGIYDEPFADSSAMPTYRVCELARKHVTVALSGDGGDEVLAGYRRYRWHLYEERLRGLVPYQVRRPLFGTLAGIYPKADWAPKMLRAKATFEALAMDSVEGYFHSVSILGDRLRSRLFSPRMRRALGGYHAVEALRRHQSNAPDHPLSRVQYLDIKTYLPGDILTKVDRASMANSLEVRVPILDHEFVEWTAGLPPEWKLEGREGKSIFKKALATRLSDDILYRSKMGFSIPLAEWFRGPLRERVRQAVLGPVLAETGYFNYGFLQTLVIQHEKGQRDHSAPLWSLLMFDAFIRRWLWDPEQTGSMAAAEKTAIDG